MNEQTGMTSFQSATETVFGNEQCDLFKRKNNECVGKAQKQTLKRLLKKLKPFVYLEDQHIHDNTIFADEVARRLNEWATTERARRIAACPDGFEHLVLSAAE